MYRILSARRGNGLFCLKTQSSVSMDVENHSSVCAETGIDELERNAKALGVSPAFLLDLF